MTVLVVDGANVGGSRPAGWGKDRAGAARRLHEALLVADLSYDVVLVLEGAAKGGVRAGRDGHLRTVHAAKDGDATIVEQARAAAERGERGVVGTADRMLRARVSGVGAQALSPGWLLDQI